MHPSPPTSMSESHGSEAFFIGYHNPSIGYHDELYDYGMELNRKRRLTAGFRGKTRTEVGNGKSDRSNIVASKGSGERGNLTFILAFNEVRSEDFGDYVCQLRHKLGVQEFPFQLLRKSGRSWPKLSPIFHWMHKLHAYSFVCPSIHMKTLLLLTKIPLFIWFFPYRYRSTAGAFRNFWLLAGWSFTRQLPRGIV